MPCQIFPPKHDAAADAGAQRDHGHVRDAASSAQPLLAERGNVGVIFEDDTARFSGAQTALDFRAAPDSLPSREDWPTFRSIPVCMSMMPGTPMPAPRNFPDVLVLAGEALDRIAHFVDDVVAAEGDFGSERNFFEKLSVAG